MSEEGERRQAQIDALIGVVGSMLTVFDVKSDAAELWPETMRNGTPEEIRQVTAELADVLPAALLRMLPPTEPGGGPAPAGPRRRGGESW